MATRVDDSGWPARLAVSVGQQVKHFRERPQWRVSAQELAERTRLLGHELKRSVIANLESGRRNYVTLADVFVLARALNVPPVALLVPTHAGASVEVLDNDPIEPWAALEWFNGQSAWLGTEIPWANDNSAWHSAAQPFFLKHLLDMTIARMNEAQRDADELSDNLPAFNQALKVVEAERRHARELRNEMEQLGLSVSKSSSVSALLDG